MTGFGGYIINLYGQCPCPCLEIEQELREELKQELERQRKEILESLERLGDRQAEVKRIDKELSCLNERPPCLIEVRKRILVFTEAPHQETGTIVESELPIGHRNDNATK